MTKELPVLGNFAAVGETHSGCVIRNSSFVIPPSTIPPAAQKFMFLADWERALMLHYEVAPEKLQPYVPFELDVLDGKAYVSLVAFTMRGLRPARGGRLAALPFKPIATHELLNVRTYVKHCGESGIFFLVEWIPNLLSVPLGPPVFGLPYRWGKIDYLHEHEHGILFGDVRTRRGRGRLRYRARVTDGFAPCPAGSLAEWLMERYVAFTEWRRWMRCFRVRHEPWPQCAVDAEVIDDSLLARAGPWARYARLTCANYSPGVRRVQMSRPVSASAENLKLQNTNHKWELRADCHC
jgi:uncharacterized protein YqjF (DUF2071 family)